MDEQGGHWEYLTYCWGIFAGEGGWAVGGAGGWH